VVAAAPALPVADAEPLSPLEVVVFAALPVCDAVLPDPDPVALANFAHGSLYDAPSVTVAPSWVMDLESAGWGESVCVFFMLGAERRMMRCRRGCKCTGEIQAFRRIAFVA
jgi:hypothetical protein